MALVLMAITIAGPSAWAQRLTAAPVPAANQLPVGRRPQQQQRRVALVIGNGAYVSLPHLPNPPNDARLIGDTLKSLGFTLVGGGVQIDLDKPAFDRAVQQLGQALQNADVGLFYYAGHGLQVQGTNWLVPIGANPASQGDLDFQMIDANLVLRQMQFAHTHLNVMILDACRNNPFGNRRLRAAQGGLAEMKAPDGTLIAYATQPGNVAQDGDGADSPFSTAVARTLRQPGLDVFRLFNQVGLDVQRETSGEQQPWMSSSPISGEFYFSGVGPNGMAPAPPVDADVVFWQSITGSTNPADYAAYLQQFPAGRFADLARRRAGPPTPPPQQQAMVIPPMQRAPHEDGPAPPAASGLVLFAAAVRTIDEFSARAADSYALYVEAVNPERGPSGKESNIRLIEVTNDIPYVEQLKQALGQPSGSRSAIADYAELPEPARRVPLQTTDRGVSPSDTLSVLAQRYVSAAEALQTTIEPVRLYYEQHDELDDHFAKGRAMHPVLMAAFRDFLTASARLRARLETMSTASRDAYLNALPPTTRQARLLLLQNLDQARQLTRLIVNASNDGRDLRRIDPAVLKEQMDPVEQSLKALRQFASERPGNADLLFDRGRTPDSYFDDAGKVLGRSKALWRGLRDHKTPDFTGFTDSPGADTTPTVTLDWLIYHFNNMVFHVNDNR